MSHIQTLAAKANSARVALGILLALSGGVAAQAQGLVGSTVHPVFYASIPEIDGIDPPNINSVDQDIAPFTIANGSSFQFTDELYQAFGTFMTVSFSNNQITLTNLVAGIFPPYTAASFQFPGKSVLSASVDASSSTLFAPGSILTVSGNTILLNLSGTCEQCVGMTTGGLGESIVLDVAVAAVPEPASGALFVLGALALMAPLRRALRGPAA